MEINKLLDECKAKIGVDTDYKLAKYWEIKDARIGDYRAGRRIPDAMICFKMAELLDIDEKCLIAYFEGLSAKSDKSREFWKKKLVELGGIAASIFVGVNLIMTPAPSEAAPMLNIKGQVCILCKIINMPAQGEAYIKGCGLPAGALRENDYTASLTG